VASVDDHFGSIGGDGDLRFGLVGTGYWAQIAHARALASTPGIRFSAVWGRSRDKATDLAAQYEATAYTNFEAFLADIDGVAFSVPPDVQCELATRAAIAGKHLLLEKPVSTSAATARALAEAARDAQVATIVFFTARFSEQIRAWLADSADKRWTGGQAVWLGGSTDDASPFNTPWRREKGGLWDLGPHAISVLWASLGPVTSVTADAGLGDVRHLVLHHDDGRASTATLTVTAPPGLDGFDLYLWGQDGKSVMPALPDDPADPLRVALAELVGNIRSGRTDHPCDVQFGSEVTRLLASAQQQVDDRRRADAGR
jgi:predicted dehydrogenase